MIRVSINDESGERGFSFSLKNKTSDEAWLKIGKAIMDIIDEDNI